MNSIDEQILKLRIQIEKETNVEIKKILLAQKQYLEEMRMMVGNIYMKFSDTVGLNISIGDRNREIKKVEKDLTDMRSNLAKTTITIAGAALLKSYVNSYYKTANIIDNGLDVSVGINYKIIRMDFLESLINAKFEGRTYSDRIWKDTDTLVSKLYTSIEKGLREGTPIDKLSKDIKDTFGSSAYQANRLVNTEMARVVTEAQSKIYEDSSIVQKVMFVATLDSRTNPEDASFDGNIYDLSDTTKPKIPLHPNCRCVYVPVVEGWNPKVRRNQETKSNIPYVTYEDWKKDNK